MNAPTSVASRSLATSHQPPLLPLEILVEIFLLSLPPTNHAQAPQKTALALVCRYWNSIIESTPFLWSQISIADTTSYIQKSLQKPGTLLIDVNGARMHDEGWMIGRCDGVCCGFMLDVLRHSERWRHAVLQISCGWPPYIPMVLKTPLPSLKTLELYSEVIGPLHDEFLELLQKENAPNLQEVYLDFMGLPHWNISFPPGLSKLAIHSIPNLSPTLIQVLSWLVACPNLTTLHLCCVDVWMNDRKDSHATAPAVVELAILQDLKLEWIKQEVAQDLLRRLRFPEDCTVSLICQIHGASPSTSFLTPAFSRYYRSFDCVQEVETTRVVLGDYGEVRLEVVCWQRWRIGLVLWGAQALRDSLKWFGISTEDSDGTSDLGSPPACFAKPSHAPVSLNVTDISGRRNSNILTVISGLECITRIEAPGSTEQQMSLLHYLSGSHDPTQPTTNMQITNLLETEVQSHNMGVHPFPGLCELVVNVMEIDVLSDVVSMVRS